MPHVPCRRVIRPRDKREDVNLIESTRNLSVTSDYVNPAASLLDVVDSARMLSFDDERRKHLMGGYKSPFDPRPSLRKLESQQDTASAWQDRGRSYTTKAMLEMRHTLLYQNSSGFIATAARLSGIRTKP